MNHHFRRDDGQRPTQNVPSETSAREREQLEWLATFSRRHKDELRALENAEAKARHDRELLEWLAGFSEKHRRELRTLLEEEAEARQAQQRRGQNYESPAAQEVFDPSKHPRLGGPPNAGWWATTGGSGSASASAAGSGPLRTAPNSAARPAVGLAAVAPPASPTWPTFGPSSSWLSNAGAAIADAARTAAHHILDVLAAAVRNATMAPYWSRVPGAQAMPGIWVYELEKRVRAGKLSHEDAVGIFNTAVLGAEAQGFAPTGSTMSAVHNSAVDFLGQAEAVYFARKKNPRPTAASLPGAYQNSGGRVFPTEKNSGLRGAALRQEQEDFFERGLSQGKLPEELRGQAHEAGMELTGHPGKPDQLEDPEVEAALQRAMQKTKQ